MTIEDKGLPFHKNSYKFGNLFVLFKVVFPESLDETQRTKVQSTLSSMKTKKDDVDMEVAETVTL